MLDLSADNTVFWANCEYFSGSDVHFSLIARSCFQECFLSCFDICIGCVRWTHWAMPNGFRYNTFQQRKKRHTKFDGTLWRTCTHDSIGPECKVMGPDCNENDLYIYIHIYIYIAWVCKSPLKHGRLSDKPLLRSPRAPGRVCGPPMVFLIVSMCFTYWQYMRTRTCANVHIHLIQKATVRCIDTVHMSCVYIYRYTCVLVIWRICMCVYI